MEVDESKALKADPPPTEYSTILPPPPPPSGADKSNAPQAQAQPLQYPGIPPPGQPPSGYAPGPGYHPSGYGPGPGYPLGPVTGYPPGGYAPVPGQPPSGYGPVPGYQQSPYNQAPPTFQPQTANNNVVIGQQPQAPTTQENAERRPNAYVTLTLILLLVSILHCNMVAFLCLFPAIICACIASDKIVAGDLNTAKDCGAMALACNIFAIMYYVIGVILGIVVLVIFFAVRY